MALALQSRGMREIDLEKTLLYRNRNTKDFELIDEELTDWQGCLQRYIQYAQMHDNIVPKSEVISTAISLLSMNNVEPKSDFFKSEREKWDGLHVQVYTERQSNYDVTHDNDYSHAIAEHPCLPLYVTGN